MNTRIEFSRTLELDGTGVESLSADELMSVGGGGVIFAGCLVAAGGAAVALIGVVVGIAVYAYLNE